MILCFPCFYLTFLFVSLLVLAFVYINDFVRWNIHSNTNNSSNIWTPSSENGSFATCLADLDCSLNGICDLSSNKCICDRPWTGDRCDLLQFRPVTFPQGYGMVPNATTWGGGILYDKITDTHHLYVSRMTNGCLLEMWTKNSRIDHAISRTGPTGPYQFHDVAINTWSHNPAPLALPDGTYAIVHIGSGDGSPNGGINCSEFPTPLVPTTIHHRRGLSGVQFQTGNIHVSKSVDGPWEPLPIELGVCNNPAPWVHSNGTIYIGCNGALKRSTHNISGPYIDIARFPTYGGPAGNYEDPQIYTDHRGHFHCLYHVYTTNLPSFDCTNSTVSAHAFSVDGFSWHVSQISPYGTQLGLSNGENITLATRERPKPYFQNGKLTHLVQGVCGSQFCATPKTHAGCVNCKYKQWDYTLVSPLDV